MEKKIILNKSLKSPLSSTSKDDLFLLLTIDDTKIVWLIKSVLPSNQSIDEFWKLIEIIIPFGVKIKGVMVNSADNISVSSVFLLNHRYKILRKIFSDALYFISFSMESDEEGEYHAKILKDSMMIENDKSKLIDDYSIEFDDNDDMINDIKTQYICFKSELDVINSIEMTKFNLLIEKTGDIILNEMLTDSNNNIGYWNDLNSKFSHEMNNDIIRESQKEAYLCQELIPSYKIEFLDDLSDTTPINDNKITFSEAKGNTVYKVSLSAIFPISIEFKDMISFYIEYAKYIIGKMNMYNTTKENILSLYNVQLPITSQYRSIPFSVVNSYSDNETDLHFQQQTEFYLSLLLIPFWYPNHKLTIPYINKFETFSDDNLNKIKNEIPYKLINPFLLRTIHQSPLFSYLNLSDSNIITIKGDYFYFNCNSDDRSYGIGYKVIQTFISFVFMNDNSKRKKKRTTNSINTKVFIPDMNDINQALIDLNIGGFENTAVSKIKYELSLRDIYKVISYFIGTNDFILFRKKIKKEESEVLFKEMGGMIFPVIASFGNNKLFTIIGYDKSNKKLLTMSHNYIGKAYMTQLSKEKVIRWSSIDELMTKEGIEFIIAKKG